MMEIKNKFTVIDDGTLDTTVSCTCGKCGRSYEARYNIELPDEDEAEVAGFPVDEDSLSDWRHDEALRLAEDDFECMCGA